MDVAEITSNKDHIVLGRLSSPREDKKGDGRRKREEEEGEEKREDEDEGIEAERAAVYPNP